MSNNTTQNVPGMIYPTQKGYAPGAGNPRDSAIEQMNAVNTKQTSLGNAVGGYRRKRGGGTIAVPTVQVPYTPTGGPGTDPNSQIAGNMKTSTQGTANAVYDKQATNVNPPTKTPPAKGGSRKRGKGKNGGNPDWLWGCYSGGKKSRRKTRKTRKNKKSKNSKRRH
jgi:hypothetical protein